MITLSNETLTLKINESNPLYKVLSGCVGESFTVYKDNNKNLEENDHREEKKDPVYGTVSRDEVWFRFDKAFPEKAKKNTMVAVLIKNHLYNVIGGPYPDFDDTENIKHFGQTNLEMVGDDLYKNGNSYLKHRK